MPSNNIEIEAKVLLKKRDYDKLIKNIPFDEHVKVQENYYLDNDQRDLDRYSMMIRLRRREGRNKLTLKAPLGEGLLDKSQFISDHEADQLIDFSVFPRGDVSDFLEILHIDHDSLSILGELVTERRECIYDGYPINISKNTYSEKVDYELECDSDSALTSQNILKKICETYSIEYVPNTLSKDNRAIKAASKKPRRKGDDD